jgi:hypothetical protein
MRTLLCCVAALACACGDNRAAPGADHDAGVDAAPPTALGACLDRPTELATAPTGGLPCELVPPALGMR